MNLYHIEQTSYITQSSLKNEAKQERIDKWQLSRSHPFKNKLQRLHTMKGQHQE